jgi:DNA-binding MarR family transcriptional regulator
MPEPPVSDQDLTGVITPLYALSVGMAKVIAGKPAANRLALLQAVQSSPGIRPSRVAELLNLHQSQVTRQVQALEEDGLVSITGDPADRRSRRLTVTPAGCREIDRLTEVGMARWREFVDGWDPAEVRELGRLLGRLHTSITDVNSRPGRRP